MRRRRRSTLTSRARAGDSRLERGRLRIELQMAITYGRSAFCPPIFPAPSHGLGSREATGGGGRAGSEDESRKEGRKKEM